MNAKTKKKRIVLAAVVATLAVGAVGVGAVTTYETSISGNRFSAEVPNSDANPDRSLLVIEGAALQHTFNTKINNDSVTAEWTLTNKGKIDTNFDGAFQLLQNADPSLSDALSLEFGDGKGNWFPAGTVANPTSYVSALGHSGAIASAQSIKIPVRVTLADPTKLTGNEGDTLTVNANFVVSYLDPSSAR